MQALRQSVKALIHRLGYDISRIEHVPGGRDYPRLREEYSNTLLRLGVRKAQYGCGEHLFGNGWVNIDWMSACRDPTKLYMRANLASRHPFPSDHFRFAFAVNFMERFTQAESIIFLAEAFRCLQVGGVLRLSFPGLPGVLDRHYRSCDYDGTTVGMEEAFTRWGNKHFYCEEALAIVARHIGFTDVQLVEYGTSVYEEVKSLENRVDQRDLMIYAELTK